MPTSKGFVPNEAGIAALLVSPAMSSAMYAAGQDVAEAAARRVPHRAGALAAAFRVESATATIRTRRGGQSQRASGRVVNDQPYALAVEFGYTDAAGRQHTGTHVLGALAATRAAKSARAAARAARRESS